MFIFGILFHIDKSILMKNTHNMFFFYGELKKIFRWLSSNEPAHEIMVLIT